MYNKKTIFVIFATLHCFVYAMELSDTQYNSIHEKFCITSIKTAPEECIVLLKQLREQPLFTGKGLLLPSRVLPLASRIDCRIAYILCRLAKYPIFSIKDEVYDNEEKCVAIGIGEYTYEANVKDLDKTKKKFVKILEQLTTGWKKNRVDQSVFSFHEQPEEEWSLYSKPGDSYLEETLMQYFVYRLNLAKDVKCAFVSERRTWYLSIQKKSFDNVVQKLGLQFEK